MTLRFNSLVAEYLRYLKATTKKLWRCAPIPFFVSIPLVSINQVLFILSFLLPLKVIVMIGTDGVPRYLRFFVTEDTRQQWIILLCLATVGIYLLYLATNVLLERLGRRGGEAIRRHSNKAALFHGEDDFAQNVFLKVAQSWGTAMMIVGGVALALLLEWRLAAVLLLVVGVEVSIMARLWNRYQLPEHSSARELFIQNRGSTLQGLAGINTLVAFGVLVILFLTDPSMNFIIGLIMFILTRQVMQRLVIGMQDASFLVQQRERIEALVHPERHVREKRQATEVTFEMLLMPSRRERLFDAIVAQGQKGLESANWEWVDCSARGHALFLSSGLPETDFQYRLKIVRQAKDAGLARELLFYRSESARDLGLSAALVGSGEVFGRGFIALKSGCLSPLPAGKYPELLRKVRLALWSHRPDEGLANRLGRSFAALPDRIEKEQLSRIRLGCNRPEEERLLDTLLDRIDSIRELIGQVPKSLINRNQSPVNMLVTDCGEPILLNWDSIAMDSIGSELSVADLDNGYEPDEMLPALPQQFRLVVHMSHLGNSVSREAYRAAMEAIPPILQILEELDRERPTGG